MEFSEKCKKYNNKSENSVVSKLKKMSPETLSAHTELYGYEMQG